MKRPSIPVFLVIAVCMSFLTPVRQAGAAQGIVNPWVSTDRSVSTRDFDSMIADITRGLESPRQQAEALYSFFQRTMFPYTMRNEYPYPVNDQSHMFDFMRVVNVYGYALCTQANWMFAGVCRQSGLFEDARAVSVPGHGTAEVKWDGEWHFIDPIVGCFVYERGSREIASIDDIVADTTLLTRARAEGRGSVPLFPWSGEEIYPYEALARADQWYTYRKYQMDFLLGALSEYKVSGTGETTGYAMDFELRPGFRLTRMWDHLPGMYNLSYDYFADKKDRQSPSPAILPPHHPDRGNERRDTINWPIVRNYRKVINGRESYHYYANGVLSYEDDFTDRRLLLAADSVRGLVVRPGNNAPESVLQVDGGPGDGEAVLSFEAPYVFTGGTVSGRASITSGSWIAVYMDVGERENWLCLGLLESGADFSFPIPAELLGERYGFRIKIRLHDEHGGGSVSLIDLRADAVCQLNMYSLPFLAPGTNRVEVEAAKIPEGCALAVTYRWQEKGFGREHTHVARTSRETCEIEVAGEEYPKMREVVMEALPPGH